MIARRRSSTNRNVARLSATAILALLTAGCRFAERPSSALIELLVVEVDKDDPFNYALELASGTVDIDIADAIRDPGAPDEESIGDLDLLGRLAAIRKSGDPDELASLATAEGARVTGRAELTVVPGDEYELVLRTDAPELRREGRPTEPPPALGVVRDIGTFSVVVGHREGGRFVVDFDLRGFHHTSPVVVTGGPG